MTSVTSQPAIPPFSGGTASPAPSGGVEEANRFASFLDAADAARHGALPNAGAGSSFSHRFNAFGFFSEIGASPYRGTAGGPSLAPVEGSEPLPDPPECGHRAAAATPLPEAGLSVPSDHDIVGEEGARDGSVSEEVRSPIEGAPKDGEAQEGARPVGDVPLLKTAAGAFASVALSVIAEALESPHGAPRSDEGRLPVRLARPADGSAQSTDRLTLSVTGGAAEVTGKLAGIGEEEEQRLAKALEGLLENHGLALGSLKLNGRLIAGKFIEGES